jgi:hypothetical protein
MDQMNHDELIEMIDENMDWIRNGWISLVVSRNPQQGLGGKV